MTKTLADTWHMTMRHVMELLRQPIWIFVTLVQPIIWLLLFGALFESVTDIPGFGSDNYIEFREKPYEQFLAAKAAKQETTLLELLVEGGQGSSSEFYRQGEPIQPGYDGCHSFSIPIRNTQARPDLLRAVKKELDCRERHDVLKRRE